MADILKLKHIYPNELPDQKFYFYEGECDVHYGVIELPLDPNFEHWAVRAWMKGFRLDPETGRDVTRDDIAALYAGLELPAADAEAPTAEVEAPVEGANGEQVEEGLAVELEGGAEAGVPEPEGEGADEAEPGPSDQ